MVGNPLPTRSKPLPDAEEEAKLVAKMLRRLGLKVDALMKQEASKAAVQLKIEGATWGHFACHGDFDTISILAERKVESSAGAASGESKKPPGVKVGQKKKNPVVVKGEGGG